MKKSPPVTAAWLIGALLCVPSAAHAQSFIVGSFTKNTTSASGCSSGCPTNVVTHNLGVTPKAMILWTNGKLAAGNNTFGASYNWGFGMTDGTAAGSWVISAGSVNGVGTNAQSQASRRVWNKAIQLITGTTSAGGTLVAEADFTSWTTTQFTITWTTNDTSAYVIHYLIIGGTGVSAQVLNWIGETPVSVTQDCCTATAKPTNALTFQPDLILNASSGSGTGSCFPCSGTFALGAGFGLGVMDTNGDLWANSFLVVGGVKPKDTQHGQKASTDFVYDVTSSLGTSPIAVTCTTTPCLFANGFRMNWTGDGLGGMRNALALQNVNFKVGTFNKCSSTGGCSNQNAISGLGFQPGAVILTSVQDVTQASPVGGGRYGFGASDGTNEGSIAIEDLDCASNCTSVVSGLDSTTKAFTKANNDTGTVEAQADITMNAGGFTVAWSPNDTATTEILYIALGPLSATSVTLASFTATRSTDGKVRLDWRTGYEVNNVGFRVYREQNGTRVRLTPLVSGSALLGGGRGMSTVGRSYSWSDTTLPSDAGPVQYWLEDVDLKGKSTWHGPIAVTNQQPTDRRPR